MRIDKYLWAVRIFKTRTQATDACKKGKVLVGEQAVKPSREIKVKDTIEVKKNPVIYTYRVKEMLGKRVGAKLVEKYVENLTPPEELEKLKLNHMTAYVVYERGSGRPTKKERRDIDKFQS